MLLRWYIDTRSLTSETSLLPLLETLQPTDQEKVKKYYHLADRHMSLASNLLKYLFIHRACRIPWHAVSISQTPAPHHRPCFIPPADGKSLPSIEFNVSHQASMVALAGTIISPSPDKETLQSTPQVGIDITCVDEPSRRGRRDQITTSKGLEEFVDIFSEVFSPLELGTIKKTPAHANPANNLQDTIDAQIRLFYTYWALKEAYIKMTGEALLAPWLRELEFTDVVAPDPVDSLTGEDGDDESLSWGRAYTGVQTWLHKEKVTDVRVEVVAFEQDYLVATAARGGTIGALPSSDNHPETWGRLRRIDIERDVAPCATGTCNCLRTT
ncbi:hypothetical protein ASPZODRAFT_200027 [Penicilliopsis zonata CBS 506.65]|uniref:holo-[acyl-carrier-protein] synthase n=1 Tax=Penicilliopsis zonata CBS 506.65 TaxID=1073090 RepID=A0A1L9STJ1_9EURO|nr:hypothetical protein ASPZODRAFT_200027 [Penicilliopsis zonata CBS 506.65]OJJ50535.1 hypothetical protein ASPZODRAFT_200027 [Penicilliopsis zonata CBS 506.65]